MIGDALAEVASSAKELADDPLLFLVKFLRVLGVALLAAGGILAVLGYYLKSESVRAHQEVGSLWAQITSAWGKIGAAFNNLQPLQNPLQNSNLPILTKNPLTDLANLGSDIISGIGGIVADISTGIQDLAQGLEDIPPALVALGQALGSTVLAVPSLLGGELTYFIGGATGGWMLNVFPYVLIAGAAALIASFAIGYARAAYRSTVKPAWDRSQAKWAARQQGKLERRFDQFFHNPKPEEHAPAIVGHTADAPEAPSSPPEGPGGIPVPPAAVPLASAPAAPIPGPPETPAEAPPPPEPVSRPLPHVPDTQETERILGEGEVLEPTAEEVEAMERAREESLPVDEETIDTERRIELLEAGIA
jgi:hypothetical protein